MFTKILKAASCAFGRNWRKNGHESDLFEKYYGTSKPIDQQCTSTSTFSFAAKFIALPSLKLELPISKTSPVIMK